MSITSRTAILSFGIALSALPAMAADKIDVGVLRFVSSGGVYLAYDRGYFTAEGLEVKLNYFEAAQPIAVAAASGDVNFGVTAITAGSINLAAKGAIKIIASQGAEKKGYKGNEFVVSNAAYARGVTSVDKISGISFAITQVGSSQHYMMGQMLAKQKLGMDKVQWKPLQDVPSLAAAVRGGSVDGTFLTPIVAKPLIDRGEIKHVAFVSEVIDYQYGAVFASAKTLSATPDLARKFLRAYQKGNSDYAKAFLRLDAKGELIVDADSQAAALQIAKYVVPNLEPEKGAANVIAGIAYVEGSAKLELSEVEQQLVWYKSEKMVADNVALSAIVDTSFLP